MRLNNGALSRFKLQPKRQISLTPSKGCPQCACITNSILYFTYIGENAEKIGDRSNALYQLSDGTIYPYDQAQPRKNGWTSASLGVMRLAGSRTRHLSNKSTNDVRSLCSSSFIFADDGGMSLVRRSRVGLEICTLRATSWNNPVSNLSLRHKKKLTAPVIRSLSMLSKPPISS